MSEPIDLFKHSDISDPDLEDDLFRELLDLQIMVQSLRVEIDELHTEFRAIWIKYLVLVVLFFLMIISIIVGVSAITAYLVIGVTI